MPEPDLKHLSYSSLDLYQRCPYAWKRRYIDRAPSPRGAALVFGTATHNALEALIRAEAEGTPTDPLAVWRREWGEASAGPGIDWGRDSAAALEATGAGIVTDPAVRETLRWLGVRRDRSGLWIERKIELRVFGVPVPVIGFIDLIDEHGVPCDLKTASQPWPETRAANERQPRIYLAALAQLGYDGNPERRFRHVVITKNPVTVTSHETEWSEADLAGMHAWVQRLWRRICAGDFRCGGDAWCPFAGECAGTNRLVGR